MSAWNFIKHFPCNNLSRQILRVRPHCFFTSSTHASSFSIATSSSSSCFTESLAAPYLSVRIHCPKHFVDPFSEALLCFGASSVAVDEDIEEDDEDATSGSFFVSKEICIESIFPVDQEVKMCISQAANSIGLKEIPKFKVEMGDELDWITKNQESFQPVEIAERLRIVPEWTSPPERFILVSRYCFVFVNITTSGPSHCFKNMNIITSVSAYAERYMKLCVRLSTHITILCKVAEAVNIILNPGFAFGTGEHPTTKLCLLLLQSLIKGGEAFLYYSTGSGILAIAALKFGAALSVGIDIDPETIKSARHNAALNNIQLERLELHLAPSEKQFDVVIANILLNPVMELADYILSFATPGATIGISGILSEHLPNVKERYSPFLEDISVATIGDWVCMSGTKKRS